MAALTEYNNKNKVILSLRVSWILDKLIYGKWVWKEKDPSTGREIINEANHVTCYTYFTNYSYKYVGMDFNTAKLCRKELSELLERNLKYSFWDDEAGEFKEKNGGKAIMSDVIMQDEGGLWTVLVNVQEQDSIMRRAKEPNFGFVELRVYDL